MTVLELALIDIRDFKEVKKIVLKPGLNIIQGQNGSGKSTLFTVIFDLFFPSYENYLPTRSSQAAVLFRMNNGEVYRLLRNFSKQTVQLYKLDASKKLALLDKDEAGIRERLRSLLNLDDLSNEKFFSTFFLNHPALPSCHPVRKGPPPPVASGAFAPMGNPPGKEKTRERIEALKKEAEKADRVAQKESELLDYKDKAFSIKRALNDLTLIESNLSEVMEKESSVPGFNAIPKEIHTLMEEYEKNLQEKNIEEQHLIEETEIIEQQLVMEQQPLIQNKFLWAGVGLAGVSLLGALILPAFMDVEGVVKGLDFLGLLGGIGLVLFALIGDFQRISRKKIWKDKLDNKNKNLEMLNVRFQRENSKYFEALAKTESEDKNAFETKLSAFQHLMEEKRELLVRKEQLLQQKTKESLEAELTEANEKAASLEQEIQQLKPGTLDPYILQNEIKTLEESLVSETSASSFAKSIEWPETGVPGDNGASLSGASITSFFQEDWPFLLKSSQLDQEKLRGLIQNRVSSAGNGLTAQVSDEGMVTLNKDSEILSQGAKDQLFLSFFILRAGLLKNIPFPLLLDDPLVTVDASRQSILLNSLRDLARTRQVILFSNTLYPVENSNVIRL
jgi:energy-coupling factor transporter ATP-binding protein EcfA2